ncbi:MAG: hypothetical protein IT503_19295 [Burkholderiaceae bacterium]|nr:hypothetical protein [Burkholderiaceae bacterium]
MAKYRFSTIDRSTTLSVMEHASVPGLMDQASGLRGITRRRTPTLPMGPYYPLRPGRRASGLLWQGDAPPDGARRLRLQGRIVTVEGAAVVGALIELWQADPAGRYRHPSAPEMALVLPGFAGCGRVRSANDGSFAFDTLVPGGYEEASTRRAPHLHLQISGRFDRLVTQLFLPGRRDNARDPWFRAALDARLLIPTVRADGADRLVLEWTAVLRRG